MLILLGAWISLFLPPLFFHLGWYTAGFIFHSSFSSICHQIPDRCFFWLGYPLPVCARCFGLLTGLTLGLMEAALHGVRSSSTPLNNRLIWAAAFLLAVDVSAPVCGLYTQTHFTRFVSGSLFGLAFSPHIYFALEEIRIRLISKHQGALSL